MLQTAARKPTPTKMLRPAPRLPRVGERRLHPLSRLAERSSRLDGCISTLIAGCDEPAMLMVERLIGEGHVAETWVVSAVSSTTMRLEEMVADARFSLLAEGPPDQILSHLVRLAARVPATRPVAG
jgi:hypothetical protein